MAPDVERFPAVTCFPAQRAAAQRAKVGRVWVVGGRQAVRADAQHTPALRKSDDVAIRRLAQLNKALEHALGGYQPQTGFQALERVKDPRYPLGFLPCVSFHTPTLWLKKL